MERVAFLVDGTGERIDCLLNPESLEARRLAGLRVGGSADGQLVGAGQRDDPLLFTGGGRTELRLDLVFDVDLTDSATPVADVRMLTGRLWDLAENSAAEGGRPPKVRLVWGKSWNVPGVVAAVAERFDAFGSDGVPRRSWLRLKLVRTAAEADPTPRDFDDQLSSPGSMPAGTGAVQVIGGGTTTGTGEQEPIRIDLLAAQALGDPLDWRQLAERNDVDNPFELTAADVLTVTERRAS